MHTDITEEREASGRGGNASILLLLDSFAAAYATTHIRDVSA
jgi:hypothetical protein